MSVTHCLRKNAAENKALSHTHDFLLKQEGGQSGEARAVYALVCVLSCLLS